MPSLPSALMMTKRSHLWRSPSISERSFAQEGLLELQNLVHVHVHDQRVFSGDRPVYDQHVFELVLARRADAGPLVDLRGIEEIEDGKMLHAQDLVHPFQAKATFAG